jgi:hypothetical protein
LSLALRSAADHVIEIPSTALSAEARAA